MTSFPDFADAPFGPLNQHMAKVKACVALVRPMFDSLIDGNHTGIEEHAQRIFRLEHEADVIKNEIRDQMPRAFSLPIFRGDLLAYLKLQDALADTVEDIAVVLTLKNLPVPGSLSGDLKSLVAKVLEVCDLLFQCTDRLKELRERDLTGPMATEILELVSRAEHAEWEADKLEYTVSKNLFRLTDADIHPTDVYLWSKVLMELGGLANHADKTAERLRRMIAR